MNGVALKFTPVPQRRHETVHPVHRAKSLREFDG
jgi:hypothetical protein